MQYIDIHQLKTPAFPPSFKASSVLSPGAVDLLTEDIQRACVLSEGVNERVIRRANFNVGDSKCDRQLADLILIVSRRLPKLL